MDNFINVVIEHLRKTPEENSKNVLSKLSIDTLHDIVQKLIYVEPEHEFRYRIYIDNSDKAYKYIDIIVDIIQIMSAYHIGNYDNREYFNNLIAENNLSSSFNLFTKKRVPSEIFDIFQKYSFRLEENF